MNGKNYELTFTDKRLRELFLKALAKNDGIHSSFENYFQASIIDYLSSCFEGAASDVDGVELFVRQRTPDFFTLSGFKLECRIRLIKKIFIIMKEPLSSECIPVNTAYSLGVEIYKRSLDPKAIDASWVQEFISDYCDRELHRQIALTFLNGITP